MPRGSPQPYDPLNVQWENIYAGLGGWVGSTYYHPGFTPQGAVVYNPKNYSATPAAPLNSTTSVSATPVKTAEQLAQERADKLAAEERAADLADPFRKQRAQYQTQLAQLTADPTSFLQSGLNKATTDAGLQGINRLAAARGQLKSGNRLMDLMQYGQAAGGENYFKQANLLSTLSGATTGSPAAAASSLTASERLAQEQKQFEEARATEEARYQQQRMDQEQEKLKLQEQLSLAQQNAKNSSSTQDWLKNQNDYANKMSYFADYSGQDTSSSIQVKNQIDALTMQAEQALLQGNTALAASLKEQIQRLRLQLES